jgi:ketosteroid isomerase-like protein
VEFQTVVTSMEGVYRGHDGIRRYMADMRDAWEEFRVEMDSAVHVGDIVVGVGRINGRGRGSGVVGEMPLAWVLKFRDGKVLKMRAVPNPEAALEAFGLPE